MYSVLGIHEASNYQTDIDHRSIKIHQQLHDGIESEGRLNFLQLYVESPHVHVRMPFRHPVTGAIVTCKLSHPQFEKALLGRATSYIYHMKFLKDKLVIQLGLRIEQVRRFESAIPSKIVPQDIFNEQALSMLFLEHPLVIPFRDTGFTHGLLPTLDSVLDFFILELASKYDNDQGVAFYDSCWKSFQMELALEEMFFGHPLSKEDYCLSVSLGTNTVNPNSITHTRGFIVLAPHNSASAGEVPPPLGHWTRLPLQKPRLERIFPLCQVLEAAPSITGDALLRVLLCDIYRSNTEIPYAAPKGEHAPGRLGGSQKVEVLCEDLSTKNSFPAPHTFGRARELVSSKGKDVKECLIQGFLSE